MTTSKILVSFTLLLLLALLSGGCTHTYKLNEKAVAEWPEHKKIAASVNLVLTEQFRQTKYDKEVMGDHMVYPFGPLLALNAETMAKEAFNTVNVIKADKNPAPNSGPTLTPTVENIQQAVSVWAFDPVETTLDVRWTLTDSSGKTLWVKTVRGSADHILGNVFIHHEEAKTRADKLMQDLFTKSLTAITSAPEVRAIGSP